MTPRSIVLMLTLFLALVALPAAAQTIGINVVLNTAVSQPILADLGAHGKVRDIVPELNAVTLQSKASELPIIQALPYVAAAGFDQPRIGIPVHPVEVSNFALGLNTWDLDAVNVTNFGQGRTIAYDGSGVYVAVLDTGLLSTWPYYLPPERIATQYAISFGGGGGDLGNVSTQPNKWQLDQNSHGTHVTSTILGYNLRGTGINGVAPLATVIPVKVLNQNGSGWSSVIARGITYVADLKATGGPLHNSPIVINMSLGGPGLDPMEKAAIDYAIAKGVVIVASAGNSGEAGMGYPGAYAPVISVAASGWIGEWLPVGNSAWWYNRDVPDPTDPANFYITDFSSRQLPGQELDVAAPGSWVVGPYQVNGQISYYFLGGTSMSSPHVAGIVALMLQKKSTLTASQVEAILKSSAAALPPGCRIVFGPSGASSNVCWGANATGAGLATADTALVATP
jgi:subtilisin family serine protease